MAESPLPVPALELREVEIHYPRGNTDPLRIVESFDLSVAPGTLHCVAGRSGSGKTSILRVIVGVLRPNSGTILWSGVPIAELGDDALATARREHMSYVDQGATVIPELTVLDNALIPAIPSGITKEIEAKARQLLESFGLGVQMRQRARTLSGGERQRLAIARALLGGPTSIALDEPTASLDRVAARMVVDSLRSATDRGTAVIVASHDPDVIAAADTVTLLD